MSIKPVLKICGKMYRKLFGAYRLHSLISKLIDGKWIILDVGCGRQSVLSEIKKRVNRITIILTTPTGFLPPYAGQEANPSESHLSGWSVRELKKLGFRTRGLN